MCPADFHSKHKEISAAAAEKFRSNAEFEHNEDGYIVTEDGKLQQSLCMEKINETTTL